ncbi:hypothetical protein Taro_014284 [Colocasia esculenta]|uniref:Uncharacterized protein n=1 Tax=Colocasia esculenta TaxID=4460 RepID=A0A843UE48_COLES|nr:hypothetical protein [Colocasia esculenta]
MAGSCGATRAYPVRSRKGARRWSPCVQSVRWPWCVGVKATRCGVRGGADGADPVRSRPEVVRCAMELGQGLV